MTTNDTRPAIYEVLERLHDVQPDPAIWHALEEMVRLHADIAPTIRRARQVLLDHENAAQKVCETVRASCNVDSEVDDGLYALMAQMSGARELHQVLASLAELVNPDSNALPDFSNYERESMTAD